MSAKFAFIDAEKAPYSIVKMCAWMGVSTSGFYEWRDRPASATARRRDRLATLIEWIFNDSDQTYGHRGIYKIVRRHAGQLDDARTQRQVSPHTFRHTAAVHLLEAGVEVNVIRGWLGHADLTTTNRYAEINTRAKIEALRNTEPPGAWEGPRPRPVWKSDEALLRWLSTL